MGLERDDVFEGRLEDVQDAFNDNFAPCEWCGTLLGPDYTAYRQLGMNGPHHFCNRDHAIKWWDNQRRQFPGRREDADSDRERDTGAEQLAQFQDDVTDILVAAARLKPPEKEAPDAR